MGWGGKRVGSGSDNWQKKKAQGVGGDPIGRQIGRKSARLKVLVKKSWLTSFGESGRVIAKFAVFGVLPCGRTETGLDKNTSNNTERY